MAPGDRIIKINGQSTEKFNLEDAVRRLRGKPGTDIVLTVVREGSPKPLSFTWLSCWKTRWVITSGLRLKEKRRHEAAATHEGSTPAHASRCSGKLPLLGRR